MQPVITAETLEVNKIEYPCGTGRYLTTASQYLYTLLWDPFILTRTKEPPAMRLAGEAVDCPAESMLLYAHPTPAEDRQTLADVLNAGGWSVLNRPDAALFNRMGELDRFGDAPESLASLKERWDLGPLAGRTYHYADREPFFLLDPDKGKVLSTIGDNPGLMLLDRLGIFAGNPLASVVNYINVPYLDQVLLDFASLFARLVSLMTQTPFSPDQEKILRSNPDLRRDFHAFGYAYLTILELERCCGTSTVAPAPAGRRAIDAAESLAAGDTQSAVSLLGSAFGLLEKENRKLQPHPAVFTDSLHGAGLFRDVGYFEFDWPQHPGDVLQKHLDWVEKRSYRLNIDFAAESLRHLALRFPRLFGRLKAAQKAGLVEFVNGTMNQSYPPFFTLESQIRQFTDGNAAFEEVLGRRPAVYASQEFGFVPQTASILAQQGYTAAVLRVQNQGDAPTLTDKRITWVAPNGDQIETLPSHPYKSEDLNAVTYNNLHLKIYGQRQTHLDFAVFSGLGDISYYRPFREELARICHYAPVFGRFYTWSEYFSDKSAKPPREYRFDMDDFDCQACFLEIGSFDSSNRTYAGNNNTACVRSMSASNLFIAAEMIESVTKAQACPAKADQAWSWDPLMVYQGHDPYMVPFRQAGNFLGGVTTPAAIQTGRGLQLVADYCGPWNSKLVVERAEDDLTDAEKIARKSIRRNLRRLVRPSADGDRYVVYNPGPAGTKIVRIKGAGKKSLAMCGKTVAAQEVGRDLLVLLSLPTNGYVVLEHHEGSDSAATPSRPELAVGQDYLENALLRAEFDLSRGTVKRLVRKSDGRDLLADGAHGLYLADDDRQECRRARLTAAGPIRGTLEFDIEVGAKRGNTARIRSRISLDAGQSLLGFQEHVVRCPQIRGDQWINHLGVRFWPADRSSALMRCYFNVLEPAEKERVFSNNLLVARGDAADVLFVNHGNQFYRCSNNEIGNILLYEQERAREFAYAVGFPRGNPVIQARAWTSPLFAEKVARKAATNENRSDDACVSFFSVDSTDVEITSCRYVDGRFLLRLANTTGQEISAVINAFCGIGQAVLTDLCGNKMADLEIRDRGALVPLRPWDIRQVALTAPA